MLFSKYLILFILLVSLIACNRGKGNLENFNQEAWIADKNACADKRRAMAALIEQQKQKLLGSDEMEIVQLLGKPDQNELYKRNQKFYYYYITPGPACQTADTLKSSRLSIRFTAMGLAKEIAIE